MIHSFSLPADCTYVAVILSPTCDYCGSKSEPTSDCRPCLHELLPTYEVIHTVWPDNDVFPTVTLLAEPFETEGAAYQFASGYARAFEGLAP